MRCSVCGREMRNAFRHPILGKYDCTYFFCESCGFLCTEEPYWLEEAYTSAIAAADTGLVQRNLATSRALSSVLYLQFDPKGRYLDVGGGYGLLTRLMRDVGFDFYWSDAHCENLLAKGFEEPRDGRPFAAATAFEVLEHVPDPLAFLKETATRAGTRTIVLSTELFEGQPPPAAWWYYAFATGQHISFFQARTLEMIAGSLGLNCYTGRSMHVLTDRKLSSALFRTLTGRAGQWISRIPRLRLASRTTSDHLSMLAD